MTTDSDLQLSLGHRRPWTLCPMILISPDTQRGVLSEHIHPSSLLQVRANGWPQFAEYINAHMTNNPVGTDRAAGATGLVGSAASCQVGGL